jgi:DNA-binding Xre family transcriptional regulator
LYEKIVELLMERGETLYDLSRATGIRVSTLYELKRRKGSCLHLLHAVKVAKHFGVPVEKLVGDVE